MNDKNKFELHLENPLYFLIKLSTLVGSYSIKTASYLANVINFLTQAAKTLFFLRIKIDKLFVQIEQIGIESLSITLLTGTFSGMVFALQAYIGFSRIGGQDFIGSVVALGMARELGPVLTGLMVTARACSAMAAELGTMRITEQIDALITLRINIFSYLIAPRILATILVLPCLSLFSTTCGIVGGYIVSTHVLNLNAEQYIQNIIQLMDMEDLMGGLIKSAAFGLILSSVGCYKGYYTHGGARGVGAATTQAVVLSSMLILITNYFLTKFLDHL